MPFLITCSDVPLLDETMPAVKITEFNGVPKNDEIFTFVKLYVLNGSVHFSITAFEQAPSAQSRVGFAFNFSPNKAESYIFFSANAEKNVEYSFNAGSTSTALGGMDIDVVFGGDQTGFYWCVSGIISKETIGRYFDTELCSKSVFTGNLFKFDNTEKAFGTSFKVEPGKEKTDVHSFGEFLVVPY